MGISRLGRNAKARASWVSAALLLSACAPSQGIDVGLAASAAQPELGQESFSQSAPTTYILRPADVINVSVFREADLSLEAVKISPDGDIFVPLIGSVRAAGVAPDELAAQIETRLNAEFLRAADVTVNVVSYDSHQVTVEGAVETPGVFTFQPGTRLSGAIALAEGPTRVARRQEIAVFRQTDEGIAIAKFDYAALQAGTMLDPILMPGDRVFVDTNGLSQFWQDLLRALPAFALFTNINI